MKSTLCPLVFGYALMATSAFGFPPAAKHLQPSAPRTVVVDDAEQPPVILTGQLQATLIVLPPEEKVATVFGGDTVNWVFDGGHVASRFISVKPKAARTSTDLHIVSDHGNEYTLQLREVSADADPHFDSKVLISPGDQAGKDKLAGMPIFVPAAELDKAKAEAAAAKAAQEAEVKAEASKAEQYRSQYANVTAVDAEANRITVRREDGREVTYDPKRLQGVTAYQEISRDFAKGDRIQFTAPVKELGVANRDLATIVRLDGETVTANLDSKDGEVREVRFDARKMRHFDHGYAVTSHSSQGVTADRVLVNMDTRAHPELINTRFAYVSVSRASHDAQIYTNDAELLGQKLSHDTSKTSAIDFRQQQQPIPPTQPKPKEKTMEQEKDRSFRPEDHTKEATRERVYTPAEHERHYAPLNRELHADDARQFGWRAENGTVQTYQHNDTHRHIHIDGPSGQFFDQQKNPITQEDALDRAMGIGNRHATQNAQVQEAAQQRRVDQGIGFGL